MKSYVDNLKPNDRRPSQKVVLLADMTEQERNELAVLLEKELMRSEKKRRNEELYE